MDLNNLMIIGALIAILVVESTCKSQQSRKVANNNNNIGIVMKANPNRFSPIFSNNFSDISHQKKRTCYAHAIAHAIRETESRIIGRKPLEHNEYVDEMVGKYGTNGANAAHVLEWQCKKRHLGYQEVNVEQAKKAVNNNRVIVASFCLNKEQWEKFSSFFQNYSWYWPWTNENQTRVIEACDLGDKKNYFAKGDTCHAVAIVGIGGAYSVTNGNMIKYWIIKNSWGTSFGDQGKIKLSLDIPMIYYDVYFTVNGLTDQDRLNYERYNN